MSRANGFEEAYAGMGFAANGKAPETFTAAELMAMDLPEVRWAVPDVLPEGVTFLAGKPKLGKSWMALGLCVAVAAGGHALGTKPVERGEVLYLALEDNRRRLQKRIRKVLGEEGVPEGLTLATDWPRLSDGGESALSEWLAEHPDARLVVVDTLARFKPETTGRRTQYDEDRASVDPLGPLAAEHGISILLVHHLQEMESGDPLDMIHGGAGLTGGVDNALVLKRQRGRADAYLHVDGRDIEEPTELALEWDANVASWCIAGDAEEYRTSQERAAVIGVLEEAGEAMTPTEVADVLEKRVGTVKKLLWHMSRDGQLAADSGKYSLVTRNPGNPGNPEDERNRDSVTGVTGVTGDTEVSEVSEVSGLQSEGVSERWARAEVLGEEA